MTYRTNCFIKSPSLHYRSWARTREEIEDTAAVIQNSGGNAIAVQADVTDYTSIEGMYRNCADAFSGVDSVVANAGINLGGGKFVEESDIGACERTVQVNLFGIYYTVKAAIPYLKARGAGKIITIGSGLGHKGNAGESAYSCSKAVLWMFTRVLAQELTPFNISVNELIPGPVKTGMSNQTHQD